MRKTSNGQQPGLQFVEDEVSKDMQESTSLQLLLNPKEHKRPAQKHAYNIRKNPRNFTSGILCPVHHIQLIPVKSPLLELWGRGYVCTSIQINKIYNKISISR